MPWERMRGCMCTFTIRDFSTRCMPSLLYTSERAMVPIEQQALLGPRSSLEAVGMRITSYLCQESNHGVPACSPSPYCLSSHINYQNVLHVFMLYCLILWGEADQIKENCNNDELPTWVIPIVNVYSGTGHVSQAARVTGPQSHSLSPGAATSSPMPFLNGQQQNKKERKNYSNFLTIIYLLIITEINTFIGSILTTILCFSWTQILKFQNWAHNHIYTALTLITRVPVHYLSSVSKLCSSFLSLQQ
jgi:hypothetical protein